MTERVKYPRTFHLPTSPGRSADDRVLSDLSEFYGQDVVVTEKMDGENTTLYRDGFHARSLDTGAHPSRDWIKGFQAQIGWKIPEGLRICGENLYARHSVPYSGLPSYFLGFSVWRAKTCLSWDQSLAHFAEIGIAPVRELYRSTFHPDLPRDMEAGLDQDTQEGFVIRVARAFALPEFSKMVAKWVRPGHVQSDVHWTKAPLIPNRLAEAGE